MATPYGVNAADWFEAALNARRTLGHSIADLIDNSVDAECSEVHVWLKTEKIAIKGEPDPRDALSFYIVDNGIGIPENKLEDALEFKKNDERHETDLGAYGLGVPTSTLSQGHHNTLISKEKGKKSSLRCISAIDRNNNGRTSILDEKDLKKDHALLLKSTVLEAAKKKLGEFESGTAVVVQYLHRATMKPDPPEVTIETIRDENIVMLEGYLGLIFQHYIKKGGVELIDFQGKKHHKEFKLSLNGSVVEPLDPLLEDLNGKAIGVMGTHLVKTKDFANVRGNQLPFTIKQAVVPGEAAQGGLRPKDHDDRITAALTMRNMTSRGTEQAPITDCQGLYLYRNMRLIEFSTWKSVYKIGANHTSARAAVYCPTGLKINNQLEALEPGGEVEDFTTDPDKLEVIISTSVSNQLELRITQTRQWHAKDDKKKTMKSRADGRLAYDKRMDSGTTTPPKKNPKIKLSLSRNSGNPPLTVKITANSVGSPKSNTFKWKSPGELPEETKSKSREFTFKKSGIYKITVQGKNTKSGKTSKVQSVSIVVSDVSKSKGAKVELYEGEENEDVIYISDGGEDLILKINKSSPGLQDFLDELSEIKVD